MKKRDTNPQYPMSLNAIILKKAVRVLLAILAAFAVGSLLILSIGGQPLEAFGWMAVGAFGSNLQLSATLNKMAVLVLCGLSCGAGYRCGLVNIGAEGQMVMGALGSCFVGLALANLPPWLVLMLGFLAGTICGGAWGVLAGWLKVRFGASEVITTVMLNYIAVLLINYLTNGPLKDPSGEAAKTPILEEALWLKYWIPESRIHVGIIIAVGCAAIYGLFFKYAKAGFAVRVTGYQPETAMHSGISVNRYHFWMMAACGAMAGLAGVIEIFGTQHQLIAGFSSGYGFDGIAVALLGLGNPLGIIGAAFLFSAMKTGGSQMQMFGGVPYAIVSVIQGLMIIFVLMEPAVGFLKNRHKSSKEVGHNGYS